MTPLLLAGALAFGIEVSDADTNPAQVCPISPTEAVTAAHVPRQKDGVYAPVKWQRGFLTVEYVSRVQDLALMEGGGFDGYYPIATHAPQPGDVVRFASYRLDDNMARMVNTATVKRVLADIIVLGEVAVPGSSGGCVLNAADEVVGIIVKGVSRTEETSGMGWALLLTPPFWPTPEEWRERVYGP